MNVNPSYQLNTESKSRTEYSARNTVVAMCARVLAILMGFFTRVVLTNTLSEDYVGLNGLFTDILNVLALSELGVGTAITYALYKPITEKNIEKQKSLMLLYKRLYYIIAGIVLVAGLLVIPFMDVLIKNRPDVDNLVLFYLIYLANSVLSYLLIYKKTLIDAHQLSYIGVISQTFFLVLQNVIQMIILLTTRNFLLFAIVLLVCTLCNNLVISHKADKLYPFLKEKNVKPLEQEEKQGIIRNIKAMLMHKVGNVAVTNTDNLLLSSLVGIVSVAKYSNYFLVIGSIRQVLNQAFGGITASVGNLGVEESKERVKRIFEASFFIGQWMFGMAVVVLYEVLTPFIELSFGSQYVFDKSITFVLCLNFYLTGMRQATLVFRDSLGLFWFDRYKSLVEAVINLVVSLILGYHFGVIGIFLGTLISTVTTSLWVEPYMLYKHRLQAPVRFYFLKYAWYVCVTAGAWYITDLLCTRISGGLLVQCILRLGVSLLVTNIIFLLVYCRSKEFIFLYKKAYNMLYNHKNYKDSSDVKENITFSRSEEILLKWIKESIHNDPSVSSTKNVSEDEWKEILDMADNHSVLSLLYDRLEKEESVSAEGQKRYEAAAAKNVLQQYHLLFLSRYLVDILQEAGIKVVLLKGAAVGAYYPVPELRKSGDIDLLLLDSDQENIVKEIMLEHDFWVKEEQLALHHITYETRSGIEIEMHTLLAEPFDNRKVNQFLEALLSEKKCKVEEQEAMGIRLPVLSKSYFAFELLLHMLQHFLRSGFGLKLLCDWVVFWMRGCEQEEQLEYRKLVEQSGLKNFSDVVTWTCIHYLGLDEKKVAWMELSDNLPVESFLREILDAEEFGKSHESRMVMMRGTGLQDYIREFHHQMQLNFPRAGKCFLAWPVLWCITLVRFVRNNRKYRKVSTGTILKEAKRRSRLMDQMKLFS